MNVNRIYLSVGLLLLATTGCESEVQFRFNQVELIKQEKLQLSDGQSFAPEYRDQINTLTTALFGTPDEPEFPFLMGEDDEAHQILSVENLKRAAGQTNSNRRDQHLGLYREHCVHCHGVTGDGAGPTALTLTPYPRDFRLGKFKFKSTPLRTPPTDHDLQSILRNGIPGTAMPAFKGLPDDDVAALIDYVKYLSIRGEFERPNDF
ncbi:MAG: cytochrome c [Pirellulaceae bacterium]